jgi:hypothetical protein
MGGRCRINGTPNRNGGVDAFLLEAKADVLSRRGQNRENNPMQSRTAHKKGPGAATRPNLIPLQA